MDYETGQEARTVAEEPLLPVRMLNGLAIGVFWKCKPGCWVDISWAKFLITLNSRRDKPCGDCIL